MRHKLRAIAFVLAGVLASAILVPRPVEGQPPFLVYGSASGVAQVVKATSNALWVSIQTGSALPGGGLFFPSQAIGDLLYASSTTAFTRLASGAAGTFLKSTGAGAAPAWQAAVLATVAPASPTGTTSTTLVMAGLAGSITTQTGAVVFCMSGYLSDNTANDGTKAQISYGTGTAPVNGAALTGTQVGPIQQYNASTLAAGASAPYGACWPVSGLTINTAYWFDTAFAAITGGTGALVQASMQAWDLP